MQASEVIEELREIGEPDAVQGMARFGIKTKAALGVSVPKIRALARKVGTDHGLAAELWKTGIHEARLLASMVDDPAKVTERQMESWVSEFDSWDVCDQSCGNLFDKTPFAYAKALEWSKRSKEFVKRAGFALMAELAVHDKKAPNAAFLRFFDAISNGATDDRNYVKKAVNWALRQIGKRNLALNQEALRLSKEISKLDSASARWVASDAVRELRSDAVQSRLRRSS